MLDIEDIFRRHPLPEVQNIIQKLERSCSDKEKEIRRAVATHYKDVIECVDGLEKMEINCDISVNSTKKISDIKQKSISLLNELTTTVAVTTFDSSNSIVFISSRLMELLQLLQYASDELWRKLRHRQYFNVLSLLIMDMSVLNAQTLVLFSQLQRVVLSELSKGNKIPSLIGNFKSLVSSKDASSPLFPTLSNQQIDVDQMTTEFFLSQIQNLPRVETACMQSLAVCSLDASHVAEGFATVLILRRIHEIIVKNNNIADLKADDDGYPTNAALSTIELIRAFQIRRREAFDTSISHLNEIKHKEEVLEDALGVILGPFKTIQATVIACRYLTDSLLEEDESIVMKSVKNIFINTGKLLRLDVDESLKALELNAPAIPGSTNKLKSENFKSKMNKFLSPLNNLISSAADAVDILCINEKQSLTAKKEISDAIFGIISDSIHKNLKFATELAIEILMNTSTSVLSSTDVGLSNNENKNKKSISVIIDALHQLKVCLNAIQISHSTMPGSIVNQFCFISNTSIIQSTNNDLHNATRKLVPSDICNSLNTRGKNGFFRSLNFTSGQEVRRVTLVKGHQKILHPSGEDTSISLSSSSGFNDSGIRGLNGQHLLWPSVTALLTKKKGFNVDDGSNTQQLNLHSERNNNRSNDDETIIRECEPDVLWESTLAWIRRVFSSGNNKDLYSELEIQDEFQNKCVSVLTLRAEECLRSLIESGFKMFSSNVPHSLNRNDTFNKEVIDREESIFLSHLTTLPPSIKFDQTENPSKFQTFPLILHLPLSVLSEAQRRLGATAGDGRLVRTRAISHWSSAVKETTKFLRPSIKAKSLKKDQDTLGHCLLSQTELSSSRNPREKTIGGCEWLKFAYHELRSLLNHLEELDIQSEALGKAVESNTSGKYIPVHEENKSNEMLQSEDQDIPWVRGVSIRLLALSLAAFSFQSQSHRNDALDTNADRCNSLPLSQTFTLAELEFAVSCALSRNSNSRTTRNDWSTRVELSVQPSFLMPSLKSLVDACARATLHTDVMQVANCLRSLLVSTVSFDVFGNVSGCIFNAAARTIQFPNLGWIVVDLAANDKSNVACNLGEFDNIDDNGTNNISVANSAEIRLPSLPSAPVAAAISEGVSILAAIDSQTGWSSCLSTKSTPVRVAVGTAIVAACTAVCRLEAGESTDSVKRMSRDELIMQKWMDCLVLNELLLAILPPVVSSSKLEDTLCGFIFHCSKLSDVKENWDKVRQFLVSSLKLSNTLGDSLGDMYAFVKNRFDHLSHIWKGLDDSVSYWEHLVCGDDIIELTLIKPRVAILASHYVNDILKIQSLTSVYNSFIPSSSSSVVQFSNESFDEAHIVSSGNVKISLPPLNAIPVATQRNSSQNPQYKFQLPVVKSAAANKAVVRTASSPGITLINSFNRMESNSQLSPQRTTAQGLSLPAGSISSNQNLAQSQHLTVQYPSQTAHNSTGISSQLQAGGGSPKASLMEQTAGQAISIAAAAKNLLGGWSRNKEGI